MAQNDVDGAVKILVKESGGSVERRADKIAAEGLISSYVHQNRIGVLLEIRCETDFAAKSFPFRALSESISMQIAASNPESVDGEGELGLLNQVSIFDANKTVKNRLDEVSAQLGEKVVIHRFVRWEIGS